MSRGQIWDLPHGKVVSNQNGRELALHLPFVVAQTIRKNDINGATLNELAPEDMDDLAENNLDRKKLRGALNRR